MAMQLTIDGREVEHPPKTVRLSPAQRMILRHLRQFVTIRPLEAGWIMHKHRLPECWGCDGEHYCRCCSSDGAAALKRLARRGFVVRVARGDWRLLDA